MSNVAPEAAAAFNAANAAFREKRFAEAVAGADRALALVPGFVIAHVLKARALRGLKDDEAAHMAYEDALSLDPGQFDALLERGNVLRALGQIELAAESYAKAMTERPEDPRPALALARLEEEREAAAVSATARSAASERAAVAFHAALQRASLGPDAGRNRAGLCRDLARFRLERADLRGALEALRQARLEPLPEDESAALDLETIEVLLRLGLMRDAEAVMQRLSAMPCRDLLRRLAQLAYRFNFWSEAAAILRTVAELVPDDPLGWLELADMQVKCWLLEDALASLDRAEKSGDVPAAAASALRASVASRLGDATSSLALYEELVVDGCETFASNAAMSMLYADHLTPDEVASRHRALFATWEEGARDRATLEADPDPDRTLRVGMVSGDLHHQHPVNIFLQPLLARWSHVDLPLTVYFTGSTTDDQTRLARSRVREWRQVGLHDLSAAVERDRIDVLIDLSGHTAGSALARFARRMAPVQVSFLGYPGSTGVPNIDWLIGDPVVTPPENDGLCSERVMRLPHAVFCFAPENDYPLPDFDVAAKGRPFTFGSFNNIPKLTPSTVALWGRILTELPEARLVLRAASFRDGAAVTRYRRMFAEAGTDPDRIAFRGPVGLDAMMQSYAEIDVALDPLPYNGGTTTLQALWMGVPVLTLRGGHFVSRMGASFLTAAGLADWVAESEADYVARAVSAAQDIRALRRLKAGLLDRPAWDADRYACDFGQAIRAMWRESIRSGNTGGGSVDQTPM